MTIHWIVVVLVLIIDAWYALCLSFSLKFIHDKNIKAYTGLMLFSSFTHNLVGSILNDVDEILKAKSNVYD